MKKPITRPISAGSENLQPIIFSLECMTVASVSMRLFAASVRVYLIFKTSPTFNNLLKRGYKTNPLHGDILDNHAVPFKPGRDNGKTSLKVGKRFTKLETKINLNGKTIPARAFDSYRMLDTTELADIDPFDLLAHLTGYYGMLIVCDEHLL